MAGFSAGKALSNRLSFNNEGEPFVAYLDDANSRKCTVMSFDETNWSLIGIAGFTATMTSGFISLNFSSNGIAHLAYVDNANSGKVTVMNYNDNSLSINKLETSKSTFSIYPNPANFFLTINNISKGTEINIIDIMGKIIYSSKNSNEELLINIKDFTNGVYIVQALNKGIFTNKKLVIN
jgi:hypothetical protein